MKVYQMLIRRHRQAAFSMIELMIVLAVAAILMAIAVPNFKQTIDRQKITAASGDLYAAIGLTRAEAIRRGTQVNLNAASGNWKNGLTISVPAIDGPAESIYSHTGLPPTIQVAVAAPPFSTTPSFSTTLSYDGKGRARSATDSQVVLSGTWTFTISDNAAFVRKLTINALGRPQLCDPAADPSC